MPTDLGIRRAAQALGAARRPGRAVATLAERWRPWRSYAMVHLWALPAAQHRRTTEPQASGRSPTTAADQKRHQEITERT